jgi:hypothetical protein
VGLVLMGLVIAATMLVVAADFDGGPEGGPQPDGGNGEGKPAGSPAGEPAPQGSGESGEGAGDEGKQKDEPPATDDDDEDAQALDQAISELGARRKEISRLTGVIANLQKENRTLKDGGREATTAPTRTETPTGTPASDDPLAGLERDPYGNVVYHGSHLSPELATELIYLRQNHETMEAWRREQETNRQRDALTQAFEGIADEAGDMVESARARLFPKLSDDLARIVDLRVMRQILPEIKARYALGQAVSEDDVTGMIRASLLAERDYAAAMGLTQLQGNIRHRKQHPAKGSDAAAGVALPKNFWDLSTQQQNELVREAEQRAMAVRSPD